jgi:hypothetical protein
VPDPHSNGGQPDETGTTPRDEHDHHRVTIPQHRETDLPHVDFQPIETMPTRWPAFGRDSRTVVDPQCRPSIGLRVT